MTDLSSALLVIGGGVSLALMVASALATAPAAPQASAPAPAPAPVPTAPPKLKALPGGLGLYGGPVPVSRLTVIQLRRVAARHKVGTTRLRQSGRRNDLLEALYRAGVRHG